RPLARNFMMNSYKWLLPAALLTLIAGCVTINVYFPAAAAQQAAHKFIGDVIGEVPPVDVGPAPAASAPAAVEPATDGGSPGMAVLNLLLPAAHAADGQPDLKVSTPEVERLRAQMRTRFKQHLGPLLDSGAIGLTN